MKQRVLTVAAAMIACTAAVMWVVQGADTVGSSIPTDIRAETLDPSPDPSAPAPSAVASSRTAGLVSYAIPTTELPGLPPDIASGARLDIWVTWQPPIAKAADLRPLLRGVLLERIVPPLLPDGPHSAILMVDPDEITDLIWGDRLGALNVVVPAPADG